MTGEVERTIVKPAADDARDDSSHRWIAVGLAVMFAGMVALGVLYFVTSADNNDTKAQLQHSATVGQDAYNAVQALTDQVKRLGGTPVASVPAPAAGQPGIAGATGAVGPLGPQGVAGPKGDTGPAPSTDFLFSLIKPLIPPAVPGDTGATGQNGKDGVDGTNGQNGQDGKDGTNGQDAPKPMAAQFVPDDSAAPTTCSYVVTYSDGSTVSAPAPLTMCPPAPIVPSMFRPR